jgi:group I intron endonuclease
MGYIYKITNTKNNKCYIGVTTKKSPTERWIAHKSTIKRGVGCPLLMKAFNKYGEDAFKFEVIIICFDEDVFKFEEEYIKKYNSLSPNGYNVAEGGKSGKNFLGKTHSEETKKKISIKSKEYHKNPEVRERQRQLGFELQKRIKAGEITRSSKSEKWYEAVKEGRIGNRGGNRDNETKNKIREGVKKYFENNGSPINKEKHSKIMTKINGRKISQYTTDDKLVASFDSIILASNHTKIGRASIQANASGRSKSAGGFIWKYDEKEPKEVKQ